MSVSMDTLILNIEDYEISSVDYLCVKDRPYRLGDGVIEQDDNCQSYIYNHNGLTITGEIAFINGHGYTLEIRPNYRSTSKGRCMVRISIPKQVHTNNYQGVNLALTESILKGVESAIGTQGVHANISKAFISRLDMFQNAELNHEYSEYLKVFRSLQSIRSDCQVFDTTYSWGNKSWQISVYDKVAQMAQKGIDTSLYNPTARFEYRIFKRRTVEGKLGLTRACDLYSNSHVLVNAYRNAIESLFSFDLEYHDEPLPDDFLATFKAFEVKYGDKALSKLQDAYFMGMLKEQLGSENMRQFVEEEMLTGGRSNRSIKRKKIQQSEIDYLSLCSPGQSRAEISRLYNELKSKLLQA